MKATKIIAVTMAGIMLVGVSACGGTQRKDTVPMSADEILDIMPNVPYCKDANGAGMPVCYWHPGDENDYVDVLNVGSKTYTVRTYNKSSHMIQVAERTGLPECAEEDGSTTDGYEPVCTWHADRHGNHKGESYVLEYGRQAETLATR
ncbi:MAG: hypothetical protein J6575_03555 [Bifidobacterium sp.]|nr:hypothetical protein [Bifidobacterium sp.]